MCQIKRYNTLNSVYFKKKPLNSKTESANDYSDRSAETAFRVL